MDLGVVAKALTETRLRSYVYLSMRSDQERVSYVQQMSRQLFDTELSYAATRMTMMIIKKKLEEENADGRKDCDR